MGKETKDRILDEALVSFAENGYKGTNLRDLAARIGLSKSALYSHFESKEKIFDALVDRMEAYYDEHFGSPEHLPDMPKTFDDLIQLAMNMAAFTIHDEKIILVRKLLLTEQFHNDRVKTIATAHFLTGTKEIYKRIFENMMADGLLSREDPDMLAFVFTSPITSLIHYCDREPDKAPIVLRQIEAFVKHFIKMYGIYTKDEVLSDVES